ncbi:MAG: TylF/MycF/NovP-related O-methyltransferase [Bacteroidia bacterium]|nr:TylF/MycF/NovP-related O-methyltransferase [Bacteroidia bacterium]
MTFSINIISGILLFILLLIVFKYLETFWSYKIPKPFKWEEAVKNKLVSKKLSSLERNYYDKIRLYDIWFQVERLLKENVEGDFAELGVHKGETAKLIYAMTTTRRLHLFDTFEGFSEKDLKYENEQGGKYTTKEFSDTDAESVRKYIDGGNRVIFHPGYFPATSIGLEHLKFSLVHLDADLYLPTLEGLKFFYARLSPGGVIIVHDYNHTWDGIKKAFDEFMPTIPESLIELPDWKGSVMIVKNKNYTI